MMAVMTAQPLPLPLTPDGARSVGAAAAIAEDDDGGRVYVHGNLAYAWEIGDGAGRRFAAVSLVRIKAATQLEVAEAFSVRPATVRRWEAHFADAGVAGLLPERKGPRRKSKLTGDTVELVDADVVDRYEAYESRGDLIENDVRVERSEDRLGHAHQLALAA